MHFHFPRVGANLVDPFLNRTIVVESSDIQDHLDEFLNRDILPTLQQMTAQSFSVVQSSIHIGVVRVRETGSLLSQQYKITSSPSSDVLIEGGTWRGCKHGLYAWLLELGVQQLAPGDRFRIVPSLVDLRLVLEIDSTPAMSTMAYSRQGSPTGEPFTNTSFALDAWLAFFDWNRRTIANYTTTSIQAEKQPFGGHYDPTAYGNKLAEFDADSLNFAQTDPSWKINTNYHIGNRVSANGNRYTAVSPTPATGGGTSAPSGTGPSGNGTAITDGTVTWDFYSTPNRPVGVANFHHTHNNTGADNLTDYDSLGGMIGIYADERRATLDSELASLPNKPEYTGLKLNLSTAVNDGNDNCKDVKCLDLLRVKYGLPVDSRATDTSLWRAGKIYESVHAARPSADFEILDLAYDRQSAPPTDGWSVSSNLRIILAQNLFNYDVYPSRILLARWTNRRDLDGFKFGIYDYWALPNHVLASPKLSTARTWSDYRLWLNHNVETFTGESTISAGSIALHWWGALKMNWTGSTDDSDLFDEWCTKSFGAGAIYIKRTLKRWWSEQWPVPLFNAYEFGLAFDDLHRADIAVASDSADRSRVAAMMAYLIWLHYRSMWYAAAVDIESGYALPGAPGSYDAIAESLLIHNWRSRDTLMTDPPWIHFAIATDTHLSASFRSDWTIPSDPADYSSWRIARGIDTQYTDDEIRILFETIRGAYPILTPAIFTIPNTTSLIAPLTPTISSSEASVIVYGGEGPPTGQEYIFKVKTGATGVLKVEVAINNFLPGAVVISLYNAQTGSYISSEEIEFTRAFIDDYANEHIERSYDLSTMSPGFYRLVIENNKTNFQHVITHRYDMPIVRVGSYDRPIWAGNTALPGEPVGGFFPHYYFVPKGVTSHYFWCAPPFGTTHLVFRDGDSNVVTPIQVQDRPRIYRLDVPVGQDKKVWRFEGGYSTGGYMRLLDLPNWFAPSREQIIIPSNLWNE